MTGITAGEDECSSREYSPHDLLDCTVGRNYFDENDTYAGDGNGVAESEEVNMGPDLDTNLGYLLSLPVIGVILESSYV